MLTLMSKAKRWYVDGTFKIVRRPFAQLLSIHAFVRKNGTLKHVPLCFVLMSHRRKRDYRIVFKAIKNLMPSISVREIMSDFEAALWRSVRVLGVRIQHRGCVFHWTQAVWRKIQRCVRIPHKLRLKLFNHVDLLLI
jgi:MULE transposase domain